MSHSCTCICKYEYRKAPGAATVTHTPLDLGGMYYRMLCYGELLQCHEENGANSRRAGESGPLAIVPLTPCCLGLMPCVIVSPRLDPKHAPFPPRLFNPPEHLTNLSE